MRPLLLTTCATFLMTQPALACANAMQEDGALNHNQMMVLAACLLAAMFFIGLYLVGRAKERATP